MADKQTILNNLLTSLERLSLHYSTLELNGLNPADRQTVLNDIGTIQTKLEQIIGTSDSITSSELKALRDEYQTLLDNAGTVGTSTNTTVQNPYDDSAILESITKINSVLNFIDFPFDKNSNFIIGDNLYDLITRKEFTDISRWTTHIAGVDYLFEQNTEIKKYSTKSIKFGNIIGGDTALSSRNINLSNSLDLTHIDIITFWIYVDEALVEDLAYSSEWGSILFSVGDLNFASFQTGCNIFGVAGGSFTKGWNNITIHKDSLVILLKGSLDLSNIQSMQIRWDKFAKSTNSSFYLDSIIIGGNTDFKTPVCITLDDSNREQFDMVNIMNSYGIPCSLNVIPDYIDDPILYTNSMTLDELDMLYKKGNHVGIHHQNLAAFSLNHQLVLDTSLWIKNNGFIRDDGYLYGSYPNGAYNQDLIDFLILNGFKGMRTDSGRNRSDAQKAESTQGLITRNSIINGGLSNSFKITGKNASNLTKAIDYVEDAIKHKSAYVNIIHNFSEIGGRSEWIEFAKYLKLKIDDGSIECLTFPQFVKKYNY